VDARKSGDQSDGKASGAGSRLIGSLFFFAILIGVVFLVVGLAPTDLPPDKGSNFVDTVFHNKGVILAARLLLVAAAVVLAAGGVFVVSSIVMRMRNREWLRRAGPFEIGDAELSDVESEAKYWRATANASEEEVEELAEQLQAAQELAEALQGELSTYEGVQVE
jgi:hypothetical protein